MKSALRLAVGIAALFAAGAPGASAQDACLEGAAALGDERALAALRTATEASCPCDSFVSGPPRGRRRYQHCARLLIKQALVDGALRRECQSKAKNVSSRSTCGTSRIACGRVESDDPVSVDCRIAPAARCADRGATDATACAAQTHCADVVDWTAGTCTDVRQRGPYEVGARAVRMVKDSVASPGQERVLNTAVWYPAIAGGGPIDSGYAAVRDAPLDASGGPYPVVMFSHGSCGYENQSLFFTALLASYGFVVVAPPHPGNTLREFPACGTPAAQAPSALERPADIIFALDFMLAESAASGSPFFGALDPTRVGMSGHSFGGLTTYVVVSRDNRFRVAVPMAPAVNASIPLLQIPSMTMLGGVDSVVNNPAIRTAYAGAAAPKYLVEIRDAGHYAFSDLCFPGRDCNPPVTRSQPEAHDPVLRWVVPFLLQYLAGETGYESFLTSGATSGYLAQADLGAQP